MITGKKEELDQYIETHRCPEHDNPLAVAWHAGENSYVIRCGAGHFPEEIVSIKSRTRQYQAGELEKVDPEFSLLPTKDLGDNRLLTPESIRGLIGYAEKYGLDPYRGHVVLMYGKPYIGIDGYLYHAKQSGKPYTLQSRPFTDSERSASLIEEGDHAWQATLIFTETAASFIGIGVVTKDEMTARSDRNPNQLRSPVVAAHPWQLAQKRAEWQAMRRGFPIGEAEEKKEEENVNT